MRQVRVVYRKYDGRLHWHQWLRWLGEDGFGVWLGAGAGSVAQRGAEPEIVLESAFVQLFPRERWFTATFNDEPRSTAIYADVTTPVTFTDDEVTMVDLDLDVVKKRDGSVYVDDEDEFAEHQVQFGYPAEVIEQARRECDWLVQAVVAEEPFLSVYKAYLDKLLT